MSGYAQEWVWRYSKARGIAKYVFLALARRILKRDATTLPTTIEQLVDVTGLAEKTIRRSIETLEAQDEIRVIKGHRRGAVHRYQLVRELRLPLVEATGPSPVGETTDDDALSPVAETSEEPKCHRSERPVKPPASPVTETTGDPVENSFVTGQRDQCQWSEGPVSVVAETSGLVRTSSSQVLRKEDLKKDQSNTAASPRFPEQAKDPNPNGNYRVVAKLAFELCQAGSWEHRGERFDITSESELVQALKDECRRLSIVRDEFDVIHRAAASEWVKHRNPHLRTAVFG